MIVRHNNTDFDFPTSTSAVHVVSVRPNPKFTGTATKATQQTATDIRLEFAHTFDVWVEDSRGKQFIMRELSDIPCIEGHKLYLEYVSLPGKQLLHRVHNTSTANPLYDQQSSSRGWEGPGKRSSGRIHVHRDRGDCVPCMDD